MDQLPEGSPAADRPPYQIRAIHELRGPNLWTNRTALEIWVDLGRIKDTASTDVPGFCDRLMSWLPTMVEHRCSVGERGGFFQRLLGGTYPAHILEHVALELQTLAGTNVGYGRARAMQEDGVYRVVIRCEDAGLARKAVNEAVQLILAAYAGSEFDVSAAVERIRQAARPAVLDRAAQALIAAARARGIPLTRVGPENLMILGQGARQRRVHGWSTDQTAAVGEEIAEDRMIYRPMLESIGVPVVQWERVHSADEAWDSADSLGLPVIVKPLYRDTGPAISPPLSDQAEIQAAYEAASAISSYVSVERFVPGRRFQLLVLDNQVVAAVEALDEPTPDITNRVHPQIAQQAVEVARLVGLDLALVTVLAPSLDRPLEEQGGVVGSITARPDLSQFLPPRVSEPRPIAEMLLNRVFPGGENGRIPIVGIAGGPERKVVGRLIERLLSTAAGPCLGHASSAGMRIEGQPLPGRFASAFDASRSLLLNAFLERAILEAGRKDVLVDGLAFDRCTVGLITGLDEHAELPLPGWGFEHPEENLLRAERSVVEIVEPDGGTSILRADHPQIAGMVEKARGAVLFVGLSPDSPTLAAHREQGGRYAHLDPAQRAAFILGKGGTVEHRLVCNPAILTHVESALAQQSEAAGNSHPLTAPEALLLAVAAAWALGENLEPIRQFLARESSGADLT